LAVAREALERQTVPVPTARGWIRYESRLNADIRIMALPAGQDPDDLIRDAPASWEPLVQAATPLVDYYFQIATRDLDLTSAKSKSEIVDRLVPILTEIRDEVERTHYVQKLARLIRADEGTIRRKLAAARTSPEGAWQTGRRRSDGPRDLVTEQPASPVFAMEEHLLTVLFRYPAYLERINTLLGGLSLAPLQAEDLERVESRALFAAWIQVQEGMDWQEWVDTLPSALQEHLRFLLAQGPDSDQLANEEAQRDIERTALLLRQRRLGRLVDHLEVLQAEAREQGEARVRDYDQTLVSLHQDKFRVHRAVSRLTAMARREEKEKAL
jgi:DNA primase